MAKKKKTEQLTHEQLEIQAKRKTAQDWMPLKDILNQVVYTKDDYVVGYALIEPFNLDLMNEREAKRIIHDLASALNSGDMPFVWYCTDRPADLEPYLDDLKNKAETANKRIKRKLLDEYAQTARKQVIAGELVEKKFYMMIRTKNDKRAEILLHEKLNEFKTALESVGLTVRLAKEKDIYELFTMFSDPNNSVFDHGDVDNGIYSKY